MPRAPDPWLGSAEWWRQTAALLALVAGLACETGCGPRADAVTVQSASAAALVAYDGLAAAYRDDGLEAIRVARDHRAADQALDRVRARWAPVWLAWDALGAAVERWAAGDGDEAGVRRAYCAVYQASGRVVPVYLGGCP